MPDADVVEVDVATLKVTRAFKGVGTINFGIAVDGQGALWVANTEALNRVRFEPMLRGHFVDNRVTRIVPSATPSVTAFDLNPGIDYKTLPNPKALATSIAQPSDVVFGKGLLWVAGFGSDRIGAVDATGKVVARIDVGENFGAKTAPRKMRGPRGLALHPSSDRLYVLHRLRAGISVVDTRARKQLLEFALPNDPEPSFVREGRGFLYDAKLSGNGTGSCASCHIDGGIDNLAWDLGDAEGQLFRVNTDRGPYDLHPLKGPLTTQTLKGLKGEQPFHWRADKKTFADFNGAFDALMGRSKISANDMAAYTRFVDSIVHMPNPNQLRDRTWSKSPVGESAEDGRQFFLKVRALGPFRCVDCHSLPTGSDKRIFHPLTLQTLQPAKVAPLQTTYRRLGRRIVGGERKSGFGLLHEGSDDDVFHLLSRPVFGTISRDARLKRMLQRFVLAFDSGTAPTVGYGRSVDRGNASSKDVGDYLTLMIAQQAIGNVELVAFGVVDRRRVGLLYDTTKALFVADRSGVEFSRAALLGKLSKGDAELSFVGVAPGVGRRVALDRDRDQRLDGDEAAKPYGAASPACATIRLGTNSNPELGNGEFGLVIEGAWPRTSVLLALAARKGSVRVLGVDLHVDLATTLMIALGSDKHGTAMAALPLPNDASLKGVTFFAQAIGASRCAPQRLEASNGLEVVVRD